MSKDDKQPECAGVSTYNPGGNPPTMEEQCAGEIEPCRLCGGVIGPDVTERLMCYGCGPVEMMPPDVRLRASSRGVHFEPPTPAAMLGEAAALMDRARALLVQSGLYLEGVDSAVDDLEFFAMQAREDVARKREAEAREGQTPALVRPVCQHECHGKPGEVATLAQRICCPKCAGPGGSR